MDYGKKSLERKREHLLKTGFKRRRIGVLTAKILFIFFLFCLAGLGYVSVRFVQGVIAEDQWESHPVKHTPCLNRTQRVLPLHPRSDPVLRTYILWEMH